MTARFGILLAGILLAGCGGQEYTIRPAATAHPEIDCRPWPRPPVLVLTDVEPEAQADGWKLDHQEYLNVYSENKQTIGHMQGTREVARYFVRCINEFNEMVGKMNAAKAAPAADDEADDGASSS